MEEKRRDVKSSITDVMTQKKVLQKKVDNFEEDVEDLNQSARTAAEKGDDDLARAALEKKKAKMEAIESLRADISEMENVESGMRDKLDELESRLDELKTEKEVLKARYEGAEAMKEVNESMTEGIGDYSVEGAVDDIEDDIVEMQSKAEAIDELEAEREDDVEQRLDDITQDAAVEEELDNLMDEVGPDYEQVAAEVEGEPEKEVETA
jgi:phage shock protein A